MTRPGRFLRTRSPWRGLPASFALLAFLAPAQPLKAQVQAFLYMDGMAMGIDTTLDGKRYRVEGNPITMIARLSNDSDQELTGITFGLSSRQYSPYFDVLCPVTEYPPGSTPGPCTTTSVLISDITVPPCGRVDVVFDADFTASRVTGCIGGSFTVPGHGFVRTWSPFNPQDPSGPGTCVFGSFFQPASRLFLLLQALEEDLPPFRPGDIVTYDLGFHPKTEKPAPMNCQPAYQHTVPWEMEGLGWTEWHPELTVGFDPLSNTFLLFKSDCDFSNVAYLGKYQARIRCDAPVGAFLCSYGYLSTGNFGQEFVTEDPTTFDIVRATDPTCVLVTHSIFDTSTKTVTDESGDGRAHPGEILTYTIEARNTAPCDPRMLPWCECGARDVMVTDVIDGTVLTEVLPVPPQAFDGTGTILWDGTNTADLAQLAPGASATLTFTARVRPDAPAGAFICNQAVVTSLDILSPASGGSFNCRDIVYLTEDPALPGRTPPSATCIEIVSPPGAALEALKAVTDASGDGLYLPGEGVSYTFTVTNMGTAPAQGVDLTDTLPGCVEGGIVLCSGAPALCLYDPASRSLHVLYPSLGASAPGNRAVVTLDAVIAADTQGRCCNHSEVSAVGVSAFRSDDPKTAGGGDATCFETPMPDLSSSTKDADSRAVTAGQTVTYTITVRNTGQGEARNVSVRDPLKPCLAPGADPCALVSRMPAGAACDGLTTPGTLLIDGFDVPAGAEETIVFAVAVADDARGLCANQALLQADGLTPERTDDPFTPMPDDPTLVNVKSVRSEVLRGCIPGPFTGRPPEIGQMLARGLDVYGPVDLSAPWSDPEPVLGDTARPLIFYQVKDASDPDFDLTPNRGSNTVDLVVR